MNLPAQPANPETIEHWRKPRGAEPTAEHRRSEARARIVLVLTVLTMIGELIAGYITGSMALTADGWHMGSHAAALAIAAFAYGYARKHADSDRFTFGTGKVGALGGYSSALLLAVVAVLLLIESVSRLISPEHVDFTDALVVAVVGLIVNVVSALLLSGGHGHHSHDHTHNHSHAHEHNRHNDAGHHAHHETHSQAHDHNLKAAYLHVVADAITSLLAIAALVAGRWLNWVWLDATVAIAASFLILYWAFGLLRGSGRVLLDTEADSHLRDDIVNHIESDADNRVGDVRLWSIGGNHYAAIVSVVTHKPRSAEHYKALIAHIANLRHVTIEVNHCTGPDDCRLHVSARAGAWHAVR